MTSVDFTATEDGIYRIQVSPWWVWLEAGYDLNVDCMPTNLPECSPTPPEYGCWDICPNGYYVASWGVSCGCCF